MNLQNLPRADKTVKQGFKPKLDCFLFADYKAIEYRILAFYLNAIGYPQMAEDFRAGLDPHRQTAIRLLGKSAVTDEERQFGKTFNFASIYGAGPKKIATMLEGDGVVLPPGRSAKDLWNAFYETNPGIRKLSNPKPKWNDPNWVPGHLESTLRMRGDIRTLWGRQLHPEFEYRALNSLIQGCAADLMRASMVRVHEFLREWGFLSHLVMTIHDELIFDVLMSELAALAQIIPTLMSDDRIAAIVPIEVDLEVSFSTWAEKEDYWESELSLTSSSM